MKLIPRTLLFLVVSTVYTFAQTTGIQEQTELPCQGYWANSYQHPYLTEADSLWENEDFEEAARLYQIAASHFSNQNDWSGLLKARNRISDNLRIEQQYDSAFSILDKNLEIVKDYLSNDPVEMAEIFFIMGVNHDWNRQLDNSLIGPYPVHLEIRQRLYGENHIDVATSLAAIGEMYWYNRQFLNAKQYLTQAVDIIENLTCQDFKRAGNIYYSLSSTYRNLGDYEKAKVYGQKALSILENATINDMTRCYNLLGNLHLEMRNYQQSNEYNFKAIDLLTKQRSLSFTQKKDLANYLNSVASNYMEVENFREANKYYQKSLKIYQGLPGGNDNISMSYQNLGINYTKQKQVDSAKYLLSKAVEMRREIFGFKNPNTSSSLLYMGNLYESIGSFDSALVYYQQAIVAGSGKDFQSLDLNDRPKVEDFNFDGSLLDALWAKGKAFNLRYQNSQNIGDLKLCLESLLTGIELMDRNRELYELEGSSLIMTRNFYGVYEDALQSSFDLFEITNDQEYLNTAFMIMEKSKARLLFDSFSHLKQNSIIGIPDSLMAQENAIKSKLASFKRDLENEQLKDSSASSKIRKLEEKVFQWTVKLENLHKSMQLAYPEYTSTVKTDLVDLVSVQQKLEAEDQMLLDYFWGDNALYTLVIKHNQISFFRQPIEQVAGLVSTYQHHLQQGPQFNQREAIFSEFVQTSHALYQELLHGVEVGKGPIIIAPDGPLRVIPFEAFVMETPANKELDYGVLDYLIHHNPISYVYSSNIWAIQPELESSEMSILGFAHANSDGANELPGTATEIEVIKSQLTGSFYAGYEATKQRFVDQVNNHDIVHLAIHGISDSISHLNNRLLFRRNDDPKATEALYTYELYNLRLNSRMAVLSACESGLGRNFRGEGVYSMSRAFAYAGCPTTVMSLWRISDKTTPTLLDQFYRQLSKGKTIDRSLRLAKIEYLNQTKGSQAHPSYWAAMVVYGATDQVVKSSRNIIIASILLLAIVGGLIALFRNYRNPSSGF